MSVSLSIPFAALLKGLTGVVWRLLTALALTAFPRGGLLCPVGGFTTAFTGMSRGGGGGGGGGVGGEYCN